MAKYHNLIIFTSILSIFFSSCKKNERKINYNPVECAITDNLIRDIIEEIKLNYVDEVTSERLEEGAINGMLNFLDEYSMYINPEEFEAFEKSTHGSFLGVGIEIKQIREGIEIISIIEDGPAYKSGLRVGDIITHIENNEVSNIPLKDIMRKLGSNLNMKIKLGIIRNKTEKFDIILQKSLVQLQTVKFLGFDDIAYIKISYFNDNTLSSIKKIIKQIENGRYVGIIIDLRGNPGGILEQAIGFADLFLKDVKIIELKSKNIQDSKEIYATHESFLDNLPITVLIDKNSASGSEIVASSLSENKRAVIIGEKSYGKGTLQTIIPIPGKGAIKLTSAYIYTPLGKPLNKNGVIPGIIINNPQEQQNRNTPENVDTPQNNENKGKTTDDDIDQTIQRAIDLLHGISALNNNNSINTE